jgi:hypothetical protein
MFFFDIPNLLVILIVILVSFRMGLIPLWLSFFLSLFAFIPFILNDVLFPASYMPDQFKYFRTVQELRYLDFDFTNNIKIWLSTWMLAFIPLPFVETINSLGFFSRFLSTVTVIWLYSSKKLRGWPLLFILFYPSFLLYSSLALRDTLVFTLMILSVILFLENRKLFSLLVATPLAIIKFQNFFLIIVFYIVHLYFSRGSFFYKYRHLLIILIIAGIAPSIISIIELVDFSRRALFMEDGGLYKDYVHIKTFRDFAISSLQSAPYFLMKPLPWEASNLFQFIQSIENIFIFIFLVFMFLKTSQVDKKIAIKWLVYIVAAFSIYGLVVFNFGTAVRYKFPFILILVVGMAYELYLKHGIFFLIKETKL